MQQYFVHWQSWVWSIGVAAGAVAVALVVHYAVYTVLSRFSRRSTNILDDSFVRHSRGPAKLILPLLALVVALPFVPLPPVILDPVRHAAGLGLIGSIGWLAIAMIDIFEDVVASRYTMDIADNLMARRIQTQVQVLRHIAVVLIAMITIAVMLMTFPNVRHVGESLFASAGLAALVAGLAARPTLSSVIAGVQIALTQPIRLEDVVIVEGEWGWIEEINTTYVVVRIWDLRRLVVPLSYFIEKPFQNWTRKTADILGTVFIYTDYTVPVEEVRQELHRILKSSSLWNEKVWGLQVTDAKEHTMELRALMSAADGGTAWDLRCYVRERLIQYLQEHHPQSLPRTRAEWVRVPEHLGGPGEPPGATEAA
jgi:small-conductance mechanosensitive channel